MGLGEADHVGKVFEGVVRDCEEQIRLLAERLGDADAFHHLVEHVHAAHPVVIFPVGRIEREMEQVDLAFELIRELGIEQGVGGHGGAEAELFREAQYLRQMRMEQGLAAGKIHKGNAEFFQIPQVLPHMVHIRMTARFFINIAKNTARVAFGRHIIITEQGVRRGKQFHIISRQSRISR